MLSFSCSSGECRRPEARENQVSPSCEKTGPHLPTPDPVLLLLGKQPREGLTDPFSGWRKRGLVSLKASAGPPGSRNRAVVQMSKAPRFSMTRAPPPSAHAVCQFCAPCTRAVDGWVPPAPPHQLLEPRLIASMQFELISCFRWSSANQGRQEAEVGAIKLTALGPGSLRRKKQSRHQKAPPPTPTSPSLGKPGTAAPGKCAGFVCSLPLLVGASFSVQISPIHCCHCC